MKHVLWENNARGGIQLAVPQHNNKYCVQRMQQRLKYSGTSVHELNSFLEAVRDAKCS
jgi:hypothetical protein